MENSSNWKKRCAWLLGLSLIGLTLIGFTLFLLSSGHSETNPVRRQLRDVISGGRELASSPRISLETHRDRKVVTVDNGIVEIQFSNPEGDVVGIKYKGISNLLEIHNKQSQRGYWDIEWGQNITSNIADHYDRLEGTNFQIIKEDDNQIEISFTRRWSDSSHPFPINVDKRFIILRDYSGFYTYAILEHPEDAPRQRRLVLFEQFQASTKQKRYYILSKNMYSMVRFQYMAISDDIQRTMPSANDRTSGHELAYPEAVLLTNPSNSKLKGEVDDKYQYSKDHKDIRVHGWISNTKPKVGFWIITPSHEFLTTGPLKQELTSHVGPTSLSVFLSCHYVGKDLIMKFEKGEPWKKVFGPIPVYLNSVSDDTDYRHSLWEDAKKQAEEEVGKWPYNFIQSKDFPSSDQRGTVSGQLLVRDRYIKESLFGANSAYVGLAALGEAGSWQRESKGYQFWVKADEQGNFIIKDVRPGNYNLYAFVPGVIGDYVYENLITIQPGARIELGSLVYEPPRNGPTLWEIGVPDRSAAEYYVPDPLPSQANRFYLNKPNQKYRQYGLWDRYTDLYPNNDLVYTVGTSDYRRDWFFAHVNRKAENGTYQETTWQVKFNLENVITDEDYTLQIALASATDTDLGVRINYPTTYPAMFVTHRIGRDNSIARHGIHGLYWHYSVNVRGNRLLKRENTLYLTQSRSHGPFGGLMYDYLRFEAPPSTS